jgi:hypothetical protein
MHNLEPPFKRYVYNLAGQKAQARAIGARTRGTQIVGVNSATGGKLIDLRCLLQGPTPTRRCSKTVRCTHRRLLNWQWRTVL